MSKPTETAEITVAYINDPKPGKKWGTIKATDGNYYWGPPSMLSRYKPGETCKVEFELGGNDGTLRTLRHKIDVPQALARPSAPPPRARTNPTDSEQIFVMCMVKERPIFKDADATATDLIAEINMLRDVYRNTFGGNAQQDDQMNDQIPHL